MTFGIGPPIWIHAQPAQPLPQPIAHDICLSRKDRNAIHRQGGVEIYEVMVRSNELHS